MTVTLQLANQVRRLGRENLTVAQIASRLALPEMAIMDALCMLGLPLPQCAAIANRTNETDYMDVRCVITGKVTSRAHGASRCGEACMQHERMDSPCKISG